MCGIAGSVKFNGKPVSKNELKQMTDRMIHRGPDDDGFFIAGNVGLGMRRLSIIDVGGGHQPIANEDASLWVVMNGEIYNYVEIRDELERQGHVFRTKSDTEVIVHAYEAQGFKCLEAFNGMFAFALYDAKRRGVWIARDRLGIKPLYYAETKKTFLFSSDLNSFPPSLQSHIDENALLAYCGHGFVPTPQTIFSGIKKLAPGHWLWVDYEGRVENKRYWQLNHFEILEMSEGEAATRLQDFLHDAVRLQLRSDVPLGMMLSGGVDSSALTAISASNVDLPISTFTIDFSDKAGADKSYAMAVAARYKTNHQETAVSPAELLTGLDEVMRVMDEPIADSAVVPTYLIARFAREKGVKVMLSGAGGDEIFGGYRRHFKPRFGSPLWFAEHLSKPLRYGVGSVWAAMQPHRGFHVWDPGIAYLAGVFGADIGFYKNVFRDIDHFHRFIGILQASTAPLHGEDAPLGYHYRRMRFDLQNYLLDNILALTDKATMGASVEGRVPLLDHRLVEFAFSLPQSVNIKGGVSKGLFREVLKPYLPSDLLGRSKEGFNAPIGVWMNQSFNASVTEELENRLASPLRGLFNQKKLGKYLRHTPSQPFLAGTLYSLYVLNRWLREHFYP